MHFIMYEIINALTVCIYLCVCDLVIFTILFFDFNNIDLILADNSILKHHNLIHFIIDVKWQERKESKET